MNAYLGDFTVTYYEKLYNSNGHSYLKIAVCGNQGTEIAYCYERVDEHMHLLTKYEEVSIDGVRLTRNDRKFIKVCSMRMNINDLYRVYKDKLIELYKLVDETSCICYFEMLIHDADFMKKFCTAPASITSHHAYMGGLLVHTVNSMEFGLKLLEAETLPRVVSRAMLLTGLFLHDIGKAYCYDELESGFCLNQTGRNFGHIHMSCEIVDRIAKKVIFIEEEARVKLMNIVLSHHSNSGVKPMTPEAEFVCAIDTLCAKVGA
ncbi:MAG: HD domain-containing protein [Deferribacterales bacterium]